MKSLKITLFTLGLAAMFFTAEYAQAQFMPVVYDNMYGKENKFVAFASDFQNGDIVTASENGGAIILTWLDRTGDSRFTKRFRIDELAKVGKIVVLDENRVMVLGNGKVSERDRTRAAGRAVVINRNGSIERLLHLGSDQTTFTFGQLLPNGSIVLSGSNGTVGVICKIDAKDKVIYTYTSPVGEQCDWFEVQGSSTEYTNAAFSSKGTKSSSVVRLDTNGKPYFVTELPDPAFRIEKMASADDGNIFLVGQSVQNGGLLIKIRPEGDIVFQKQIVPAGQGSKLDQLIICPTGEVLVGGNDAKNAYYAMLRSDGTELSSNVDKGAVTAVTSIPLTGDCIVSIFSAETGRGKVVKISKQGRRLFEKLTGANYTVLNVYNGGDLLMAAPENGRLTMLNNLGEMLFDRFVVENTPTRFASASLPANGEAIFIGVDNRIAKLAHGIYVSDIQVNKPINGYTTAVFTVTLSGYSYSQAGAPLPVTVNYKTQAMTANESRNFDPVSGVISFIPSTDGSERYLNKYVIEVPILANDFLEGDRTLSLNLADVKSSYLIRSNGKATIIDQPAIVKMISTKAGVEGEKDVSYTLGIFKTNGTALTNATGSEIVIDGVYGNGTADKFDFEMGHLPRLLIAQNQHSGQLDVKTIEDTRYESIKSVVVNFNKIFAMSDTDVSFGSAMLSCSGELYDQPAQVAIESLGNHTQLNNVMSGMFKVSLLRAKDGALQTNNSGSDIILTSKINDSSTAKLGTNFVLVNAHDLRIWADDRSSAVNLNGMVLYSPDKGVKTVSVSLIGVKAGAEAAKISIASEKSTAQFNITVK